MTTRVCCACGRAPLPDADDPTGTSELRPYGPGGAPICFTCAMQPKNRAETDRQFDARLDAAVEAAHGGEGQIAHIELTQDGPRPIKKGIA